MQSLYDQTRQNSARTEQLLSMQKAEDPETAEVKHNRAGPLRTL